MKKGIIITVAIIIAVLTVSFFLWRSHINQLRSDMESHIEAFYEHFEQAEVQEALNEAFEAELLAERLRDDDSLDAIATYIRLSEEVIRGNTLFDDDQFNDAVNTYLQALIYASELDHLEYDFIYDMIAIANMHIQFNETIESADSLIAAESLHEAKRLYEEALLIATALSFEDGIELATAGIEHAEELIFIARRAEAVEFELQGDIYFFSSNYNEAMIYLQRALDIFYELSMYPRASAVRSRIELAEQLLEEQLQRETEYEEQRRLEAEEERRRQEAEAAVPDYPDEMIQELLSNYEHNRSIEFDLITLIDNQHQPPASLIRMGSREGLNEGWYNGCGWIAAYNALIILGNPMHPAEIVYHFETGGGTVWDGVFGTYPHAIERLFVGQGYNVNHRLFPQVNFNLDNAIRNSRVAILAYMHTSAAHYIVIEYRPEDGTFIVYNDSFARRRSRSLGWENRSNPGATIDSVNALIRETPEILFTFSLITIN